MGKSWKKRLYNYEEVPSAATWHRVADAMSSHFNFSQKLFSYQQQPPKHVWENIENAINGSSTVVPINKRKNLWQYAAAASVLILLVSSSIFLLNKTQRNSEISVSAPAVHPQKNVAPADKKAEQVAQPNSSLKNSNTNGIQYKQMAAVMQPRTEQKKKKIQSTVVAKSSSSKTEKSPSESVISSDAITHIEEPIQKLDFSTAEKYMVYMDDEGKVAKLPKKIYTSVSCPQEDYTCKTRLQTLRQRASAASLTSDFGGFIQMLKHVQEN